MIVVRAPLRISFVGGGTDLPAFYRKHPGRVVSSAIDKYVYVVVNRTPMIDKVSARYSLSETVDHPRDLQHTRIKTALQNLGIEKGIEIASFANLPAKTGLGSSSSFSVALMKALHAFKGKKLDQQEGADLATQLESEILKESTGLHDQYASAFGGFNVFKFNSDGTVKIEPILLDFKKRLLLESSILLFFTGMDRPAPSLIKDQEKDFDKKIGTMKEMAQSVDHFVNRLQAGDMKGVGEVLDRGWQQKKSLAPNVTDEVVEDFYKAGMQGGAWGGKMLGAGGCLMFVADPKVQPAIRLAMKNAATKRGLRDFREVPIRFVQSGAEILYQGDSHHPTLS